MLSLNRTLKHGKTVFNMLSFLIIVLSMCFNPLTPLNLSLLPMSNHVNLHGKKKAEFVKQIHERARLNIK